MSETETGRCACEGALHYTSCWWCVYHDDSRDQATGDPAIDGPAIAAWERGLRARITGGN